MRLVELVIAPAYLWAQFGAPLDPESDTARLVDTVLAVVHAGRESGRGRPCALDSGA